jgi:hypothetical protein
MGFARCDDGMALILIAESPEPVIKSVIHLGNAGLERRGISFKEEPCTPPSRIGLTSPSGDVVDQDLHDRGSAAAGRWFGARGKLVTPIP